LSGIKDGTGQGFSPRELVFPSSENAFFYFKAASPKTKEKFLTLSPTEAKRTGGRCKSVENWDEKQLGVMGAVCEQKFRQNADLADKLLATGDAELIEGNPWGDTYWGVSFQTGEGENWLGRILMRTRDKLREERDEPRGNE